MTVWFTADTHFGHSNVIEYCSRPFSAVEEMDEAMINNWNSVVKPTDVVYHLGDFTLSGPKAFQYYIERLNGTILIVPGGHDKRWLSNYTKKGSGENSRFSVLPALFNIKTAGLEFVLCHYPLISWEKSHYGAIHLHGHSHGTIGCIGRSSDRATPSSAMIGIRFDVGVDCNHFRPISYTDIINRIDAYQGLVKV